MTAAKLRRVLGGVLLVVGLVALGTGAWSAAQYRAHSLRGPYFSHAFGMALAADGNVFVGVGPGRVHVYDPDGQPVRGWRVPSEGGVRRLRITEQGTLQVAPRRTAELLEYDLEGTLVASRPDPEAFARFGADRDSRVRAPNGDVFEVGPEGLSRTRGRASLLLVPEPPPPLVLLGPQPVAPVVALFGSGFVGLVLGSMLLAAARPR